MTMNYMNRIIIICSLTFIISCGGEKESTETPSSPRIKNFSKLILPSSNSEVIIGEAVDFEISSTQEVDSVVLSYTDESMMYEDLTFSWTPQQAKTGKQKIKVTVYSGDQSETHYGRVVMLSDLTPSVLTYKLIDSYPHDESAFVQGLFFIGDTLVESTGQEGSSRLSKINLNTGEIYRSTNLDNQYFGEGSTYWNDQIFYLTWTTNVGFIYNSQLEVTGQFNYTHEGWGMTTMGDTLIISDGQEVLHLVDPRDMSEIGQLEVYDDEGKVTDLNELEYFNGKIYANVWMKDVIISIDPKTGKVLEVIDLSGLKNNFNSNVAEVLNGIAYKQNSDQIFVTGKNWPNIFEVEFLQVN